MMTDDAIKTIWRGDHKRSVVILKHLSGYTFVEEADVVGIAYENWPSLVKGGLYDSPTTAEREASMLVPWLADQISD